MQNSSYQRALSHKKNRPVWLNHFGNLYFGVLLQLLQFSLTLAPNFRRFTPFYSPNFRKSSIFTIDYQYVTNYEEISKTTYRPRTWDLGWISREKTLLIRGARQVGKTSTERHRLRNSYITRKLFVLWRHPGISSLCN